MQLLDINAALQKLVEQTTPSPKEQADQAREDFLLENQEELGVGPVFDLDDEDFLMRRLGKQTQRRS